MASGDSFSSASVARPREGGHSQAPTSDQEDIIFNFVRWSTKEKGAPASSFFSSSLSGESRFFLDNSHVHNSRIRWGLSSLFDSFHSLRLRARQPVTLKPSPTTTRNWKSRHSNHRSSTNRWHSAQIPFNSARSSPEPSPVQFSNSFGPIQQRRPSPLAS
ncbi:hypothetical protein CRG98_037441 [Punica granatum]|uniref:Uncharacterized protein n=1 Tax=Punica granatum TaxID=22663 RepID=A0A2I0IDU8_PUNGR|nr:hypothetical protein CRG98_037441 [Punica granatum]